MCHVSCLVFGTKHLSEGEVRGKSVIEVGSCNVNGSLRAHVESLGPAEYVGVDLEPGPGVDVVCDAEKLLEAFGPERFDLVISTEVLEHVRNWKTVVSHMKNICKANGILLITTRSGGFPYHAFPSDFWRYELEDIERIFSDCRILALEKDTEAPGVFVKVLRPEQFCEKDLSSYQLSSIVRRRIAARGVPLVAVVIPTWNRKADVLQCVASLPRLTYPSFLTVVVDNGSEDGTAAALRAAYPDLVLIQSEVNRGYAGGNNLGIRWALAHGAEYVLLINNDAEVTPDLLTELVRVAEADPRIAVAGARNILMDDTSRLWGAYGALTYGGFLVRTVGQGRLDGPGWHVVKDVDFVIGNGSLFRRPALEAVGLLDETFFAYHEDVDWCVRARQRGYRVVYAGTAAIVHKGGVTADHDHPHSVPLMYFLGRNAILFLRKHGRWYQRSFFWARCGLALMVFVLLAPLFQLAQVPRAHVVGPSIWAGVKNFLRGLVDGLRGRPIPFSELGLRSPAPVSVPAAPEVSKGLGNDCGSPRE